MGRKKDVCECGETGIENGKGSEGEKRFEKKEMPGGGGRRNRIGNKKIVLKNE